MNGEVEMEKGHGLLITNSEPEPGKEAEYNKYYDVHMVDHFKFKGITRACRYRCYQPPDDPKSEYPKYLVTYEFESKNTRVSWMQSPEFAAASKDFGEKWPGVGVMRWAGHYEPLKILERKTGNNSILRIVATKCDPKKEQQFNKWYNEIHLPMVFKFQDIKSATRYRLYHQDSRKGDINLECPKYLANYEFASKEAEVAWNQSPEMATAIPDWMDKMKSSEFGIELIWSASYELLKTLGR
jgi:hypothetical protein